VLRAAVLLRVVLIGILSINVVFVVHALSVLLCLTLSLLLVEPVLALGLGELVDFGSCEASEKLLGELVGDWFAWRSVRMRLRVCGRMG
jgi:hypothetical protein